jgi:hypothetical protein
MTTVTGTLKRGSGAVLADTPMRFERIAEGHDGAASVFGRDVLTVETEDDGTFEVELAGGTYVVTWPRGVGGAPVSRVTIGVPDDGGTVTLASLIGVVYAGTVAGELRFLTIAAMLAADSRTWSECRTLNSYGADGVVSGWDRVLKTSTEGTALTANGDSILETDDERSYARRTWIA